MKRFTPMEPSPLREARARMRISQYELGRLAMVSQTLISRIELGYERTSKRVMEKLSKTLGVPVEELFPRREGR